VTITNSAAFARDIAPSDEKPRKNQKARFIRQVANQFRGFLQLGPGLCVLRTTFSRPIALGVR